MSNFLRILENRTGMCLRIRSYGNSRLSNKTRVYPDQ